jgi:ABC-type nitrate/sulfonate/bicarbonate transport system substrate-binding protein
MTSFATALRAWALPLVLLTALFAAPASVLAQSLTTVSVITFPGGFNWPIWVAQEKDYFAKNGIEVKITPTPGSAFQLTNLIEGKFDIGVTAIDNLIAYMEGQGEVPVTTQPDLVAFMGGDNGLLSLATIPEVKSFADLKGKTVSVDAMTTGYAFVLFDLLKRNGLNTGDYNVERAGGVAARWDALKEKKHAGTMLLAPFDVAAKAAGFNLLVKAVDVYGHYQGLVGATRRAWAKDHERELVAYVRGYLAGLAWLYESANKDEAIAILRKNLPQLTPEVAAASYGRLINPDGFAPKAQIDTEGVKTVLNLRSQYGQPKRELGDPAKYYDPKYYETALK